ncbi:MAG TPA: MurR/RpiR family transcriptional regulator [Candidimonas sp.]|nr:MurR/RpiR family transcriptional regulator [Candidimonas sp.]
MTKKHTPPQNLDALIVLIQHSFPSMTRQFQVGARYLIDFPGEVPITSMRQVAAQAGVQPATLVRLAQSLGYDGWNALKSIFAQSLRQMPNRYAEQARKVIRSKNPRDVLGKAVATQARNITLLEDMNADRLAVAVSLLSGAKQVHVAGFRASFGPAFIFQYLYRLFRPSVSMLRGDAGSLEMELRAISKGDVVVIVGFAPYSRESMRVAQAARQAGSRILAICDSIVAPIALDADCVLAFPTETPSFFPSSSAAVALIEILIEQLLAKGGKQAVNDIARAEDQLHQAGAYLNTN